MGVTGTPSKTVGDVAKELLDNAGVEEAYGIRARFNDGTSVDILSDSHPALKRPASDLNGPLVMIQSAKAGLR